MIEDNQNIVITGYDQHGHAIVDSYAIDDVSKEFLLEHIARLTAERDEARDAAREIYEAESCYQLWDVKPFERWPWLDERPEE